MAARCDEMLDAVEDELAAGALRARRDRGGVRAGLRLREAKRAKLLAFSQRPEKPVLLLHCAVFEDRHAGQTVMHLQRGRCRAICRRDFGDRKHVTDVIDAMPPNSVGTSMPIRPSSAILTKAFFGNRASRSRAAAPGKSSRCANWRASSRTSCCRG